MAEINRRNIRLDERIILNIFFFFRLGFAWLAAAVAAIEWTR